RTTLDAAAKRMKLVPFEMERWQSTWEHRVEFNLSESGVEPLPLRELLREEAAIDRFLDHPLAYSQGNGTPELRSSIASLYPGATRDHVLVTNGSSEACLLALWHLVEPGDEVVLLLPNYMESWGLIQMFGGKVRPSLAPRGPRMAIRSRRARDPGEPPNEGDRGLQPEQSDRRGDGGGTTPGRARCGAGRGSVAPVRRGLHRRGAGRSEDGEPLGRLRTDA